VSPGLWRVEPERPGAHRPPDTYDVIDDDGLPVTWALANLTFDVAEQIVNAHNTSQAQRAIAMLSEISEKLDEYESEAAQLYGGESPQRVWAWGLNAAIAEALRED
jgi:hypothetical protein